MGGGFHPGGGVTFLLPGAKSHCNRQLMLPPSGIGAGHDFEYGAAAKQREAFARGARFLKIERGGGGWYLLLERFQIFHRPITRAPGD